MTVPTEEATAKYVPAAAVIRMPQALSGFIGRKARLGGKISLMLKCGAQLRIALETVFLEYWRGGGTTSVEVKFVDICRNADGEVSSLDRY